MIRRLLILALVAMASLSPAMTFATNPHCALVGADCGSPCAPSASILAPMPPVVGASMISAVDGPRAVIPAPPVRLSDLPPRPVSSAH